MKVIRGFKTAENPQDTMCGERTKSPDTVYTSQRDKPFGVVVW